MKKGILMAVILLMNIYVYSGNGTAVTSWVINTSGLTGYNCTGCTPAVNGTIPANIQSVYYTTTDVYIESQGIPSYNVGPWNSNPNKPTAQNKIWEITLSPQSNTGTKTATSLGPIGIWSNGVAIFNGMDGYYWDVNTNAIAQGTGTWNRNAYIFEGVSFDACLGHPNQTGTYHNHVIPKCLFSTGNTSAHSPIIGYAFDGFPVYGPYAFSNVNGTGTIRRMTPSYVLTTATTRNQGPSMTTPVTISGVSSTYYPGTFLEDYSYSAGTGDLDQYNGRFCITPDYPLGTYAYFVTVDSLENPIYPYVLGPQYYGVVNTSDTGPTGGSSTVPNGATQYIPSGTGIAEYNNLSFQVNVFPNPVVEDVLQFEISDNSNDLTVKIMDYQGRVLINKLYRARQYTNNISLPFQYLSSGIYLLSLESNGKKMAKRIMIMED
jgi:hypothetical protein